MNTMKFQRAGYTWKMNCLLYVGAQLGISSLNEQKKKKNNRERNTLSEFSRNSSFETLNEYLLPSGYSVERFDCGCYEDGGADLEKIFQRS